MDYVQGTGLDATHGGTSVPAGLEGITIPALYEGGTLKILIADGCRPIATESLSSNTYDVTVRPDLTVEVVRGVDLAGRSGSELEPTNRCVPPPPD